MEQKNLTRNHAIKITIAQLIVGMYIQEIEQNPNYLLTKDNQKIYRLNVIATIIQKENVGTITNLTIDDSSGTIIARSFEENPKINTLNVGDIILIIGKVRTFNQEKYISPEIIKKVDIVWLKHRFLELKHNFLDIESMNQTTNQTIKIIQNKPKNNNNENIDNKNNNNDNITNSNNNVLISPQNQEELIEEDPFTNLKNRVEDKMLPFQKIAQLIKELDKGEGVLIEEIIEKSPLEKTEEIIEKMLQNGDIFQNHPGKIKVL